jgi:dephospho-CoA kinase
MRRLLERDGLDRQQAEARLACQMSIDEKVRKASYVIFNDGDMTSLEARVRQGLELWRNVRSLGRKANTAGGTA